MCGLIRLPPATARATEQSSFLGKQPIPTVVLLVRFDTFDDDVEIHYVSSLATNIPGNHCRRRCTYLRSQRQSTEILGFCGRRWIVEDRIYDLFRNNLGQYLPDGFATIDVGVFRASDERSAYLPGLHGLLEGGQPLVGSSPCILVLLVIQGIQGTQEILAHPAATVRDVVRLS